MENQRTQIKVAMNYGTLYGLSGVAVFLLFYFVGTDIQSRLPQWISYIILIIFIVMGVKSYRDEDLGGNISYGKSLGTGVLISVFGGIISAVFSLLFFTYIAPEMTQKILDAAQQSMVEQGMSEEQIEMGMGYTQKFMTPTWLFLFSVLGSAVMGFIFSLVISIFMKKEANPFNSNIG
jgi:hypothetical protein